MWTPRQQEQWKQKRHEKKAQLVAYKGGCCVDCSGIFPDCCYHFDHREPGTKAFHISDRMYRPVEELKAEADKCDLVCANCHAIRTFANEKLAQKLSQGHAASRSRNKIESSEEKKQ